MATPDLRCDGPGCTAEPVAECTCRRCKHEHDPAERFHTCASHEIEVNHKHFRVRERHTVWTWWNRATSHWLEATCGTEILPPGYTLYVNGKEAVRGQRIRASDTITTRPSPLLAAEQKATRRGRTVNVHESWECPPCDVCKRTNPAQAYATADATVWQRFPADWAYFVRNGVVILACSQECAQEYIEGIGE